MNTYAVSFFFIGFTILVLFVFIDISTLGRCLFTYKTKEDGYEYYSDRGDDARTPYVNLTSAVLVTQEDKTRTVSATTQNSQCLDSCTFDDKCEGFMFNGITQKCKLLYDIQGFEYNKDGLFSLSGGVKLRDYIGQHDADRKFMRFEGMELPPDGTGKLETRQFVKSIHACRDHCLNYTSPSKKCMAFEYDFKTKACTLNDRIDGKLTPKADKDTYVIVN